MKWDPKIIFISWKNHGVDNREFNEDSSSRVGLKKGTNEVNCLCELVDMQHGPKTLKELEKKQLETICHQLALFCKGWVQKVVNCYPGPRSSCFSSASPNTFHVGAKVEMFMLIMNSLMNVNGVYCSMERVKLSVVLSGRP